MHLSVGIVGLPNVGKSTLFNALTRSHKASAANYPFCTIDPNVGVVEVPDERLHKIASIVQPAKIIPAIVEFLDIAGLVKGASEGQGLGNQFLSHIRECDAIAQVVRFFEDNNVVHVHNEINPGKDAEIVETELILADLQTIARHLEKSQSRAKSGNKEEKAYADFVKKVYDLLAQGVPMRDVEWTQAEFELIKPLNLLTFKPLMYIANIDEKQLGVVTHEELNERLNLPHDAVVIPISAKIEEELGSLTEDEAHEFLKEIGVADTGLNTLIKSAYELLGLQTFFTAGPKEVRAWTIKKGALAPEAAGVIHSDFEKGFIRADIYSFEDLVKYGSELKIKEKGLLRSEGKTYVVLDGDIVYFHFN